MKPKSSPTERSRRFRSAPRGNLWTTRNNARSDAQGVFARRRIRGAEARGDRSSDGQAGTFMIAVVMQHGESRAVSLATSRRETWELAVGQRLLSKCQHPHVTSSTPAPHVYQMINIMCRFIFLYLLSPQSVRGVVSIGKNSATLPLILDFGRPRPAREKKER